MEILSEIWPFAEGQQKLIFNFACANVFALILLNVFSFFRQGFPIQKIFSSFFSETGTQNSIEKTIRLLLLIFLAVSFIVLVIDTQVNGVQLTSMTDT